MAYNGTRCLSHEEIIDYVECVRNESPVGSADDVARQMMFDHIAHCASCRTDVSGEQQLQEWIDSSLRNQKPQE